MVEFWRYIANMYVDDGKIFWYPAQSTSARPSRSRSASERKAMSMGSSGGLNAGELTLANVAFACCNSMYHAFNVVTSPDSIKSSRPSLFRPAHCQTGYCRAINPADVPGKVNALLRLLKTPTGEWRKKYAEGAPVVV